MKHHMISLMCNLRNETSEQRGKRDKPRNGLWTAENTLTERGGGVLGKQVTGTKEGPCRDEHRVFTEGLNHCAAHLKLMSHCTLTTGI